MCLFFFKTYSTETGPYPSPRFMNCSGSFSYFSRIKTACESTKDVWTIDMKTFLWTMSQSSKTCPNNLAYSCICEPANSKLWKIQSDSASWLSNSTIVWGFKDWLRCGWWYHIVKHPPWRQSEPQICLRQNLEKTAQTLKSINKLF